MSIKSFQYYLEKEFNEKNVITKIKEILKDIVNGKSEIQITNYSDGFKTGATIILNDDTKNIPDRIILGESLQGVSKQKCLPICPKSILILQIRSNGL